MQKPDLRPFVKRARLLRDEIEKLRCDLDRNVIDPASGEWDDDAEAVLAGTQNGDDIEALEVAEKSLQAASSDLADVHEALALVEGLRAFEEEASDA